MASPPHLGGLGSSLSFSGPKTWPQTQPTVQLLLGSLGYGGDQNCETWGHRSSEGHLRAWPTLPTPGHSLAQSQFGVPVDLQIPRGPGAGQGGYYSMQGAKQRQSYLPRAADS